MQAGQHEVRASASFRVGTLFSDLLNAFLFLHLGLRGACSDGNRRENSAPSNDAARYMVGIGVFNNEAGTSINNQESFLMHQ